LKRKSSKSTIENSLIAKAGKIRKLFHEKNTDAIRKEPSYTELAKIIVEATKEVPEVESKQRRYWFSRNEKDLLPAISEMYQAQADVIAKSSKQTD
jgi:hypothetical protein